MLAHIWLQFAIESNIGERQMPHTKMPIIATQLKVKYCPPPPQSCPVSEYYIINTDEILSQYEDSERNSNDKIMNLWCSSHWTHHFNQCSHDNFPIFQWSNWNELQSHICCEWKYGFVLVCSAIQMDDEGHGIRLLWNAILYASTKEKNSISWQKKSIESMKLAKRRAGNSNAIRIDCNQFNGFW